MMDISIIIMTRNEAANIGACLESVRNFDDVHVVDSGSTDATIAIAQNYGAKIINFSWDGQHPKKKQWCLDHVNCKYGWVLLLDADERMAPDMEDELRRLNPADDMRGYFVPAKIIFLNRVLHHGQLNNKLALLKRGAARFPELDDLDMGEVEGTYQPVINGKTGQLKNALLHDCSDIGAWLDKHHRYAKRDAQLWRRDNGLSKTISYETPSRRMIKEFFARLPLRFLWLFLYGYIFKAGFLDGREGFHYAAARAFFIWQRDIRWEYLKTGKSL